MLFSIDFTVDRYNFSFLVSFPSMFDKSVRSQSIKTVTLTVALYSGSWI